MTNASWRRKIHIITFISRWLLDATESMLLFSFRSLLSLQEKVSKRTEFHGQNEREGDITKFPHLTHTRDGKIGDIASRRMEEENKPTSKWSDGW